MSKQLESKIGSTIYDKINTAYLSDLDRREALGAMQTAEYVADALMWVKHTFDETVARVLRVFLKPSLPH